MYTQRATFNNLHPGLIEGMPVYSRDGEKLGTVTTLADDYFIIEKGIFFPKDFTLRYDEVEEIRENSVFLKIAKDDLTEWRQDTYAGWNQTEDINVGRVPATPREEYKDRYSHWQNDQVKVPIVEEELNVQKTARSGEVHARKIVHTEFRHFTVPVTREEIRIERVPASETTTSHEVPTEAFQESTINIPVMEEEVTITKRPVVKEEVRISKERVTEQRAVEGEVRKEEIRIEKDEKFKKGA